MEGCYPRVQSPGRAHQRNHNNQERATIAAQSVKRPLSRFPSHLPPANILGELGLGDRGGYILELDQATPTQLNLRLGQGEEMRLR